MDTCIDYSTMCVDVWSTSLSCKLGLSVVINSDMILGDILVGGFNLFLGSHHGHHSKHVPFGGRTSIFGCRFEFKKRREIFVTYSGFGEHCFL